MNTDNNRFFRGILTGIVLAGIMMLAFLMVRQYMLRRSGSGAQVLTSAETIRKLESVRQIISSAYLHDVAPEEMEKYLFKGVAAGLNDPYADYYSPEELEMVEQTNNGSYFGIGVVFSHDTGSEEAFVASVYESSPAAAAGVQTGDILRAVNGEDVTSLSFNDAIDRIRGGEGEEVTLTVLRGEELLDITIAFGEVEMTKVSGEMLPAEQTGGMLTGLVKIPEFDNVTPGQLETVIESLREQNMQQMILDLRDNPGGMLNSVVQVMDDLLDAQLLLSTRTRYDEVEEYRSEDGRVFDGRIAVLVNGNSASAAELLAGTLQYYGAGVIIGTTTFGKGVVQSTYTLSDGSAFKLTTEKYLIGGELDIDQKGVTPDIETAQDPDTQEDEQLQAAIAYLAGEADMPAAA